MTAGVFAGRAGRWVLVGLMVVVPLLLWPAVGLLLGVALLGFAIAASIRTPARRAWAEYLCGFGIVLLAFAVAVTLISPWSLVLVPCAALAGAVALVAVGRVRRRPRARP